MDAPTKFCKDCQICHFLWTVCYEPYYIFISSVLHIVLRQHYMSCLKYVHLCVALRSRYTSVSFCICNASICSRIKVTVVEGCSSDLRSWSHLCIALRSRYTSVSFCICNASICSRIKVTVCCRRLLKWPWSSSSFWLDSASWAASLWLSCSSASLAWRRRQANFSWLHGITVT